MVIHKLFSFKGITIITIITILEERNIKAKYGYSLPFPFAYICRIQKEMVIMVIMVIPLPYIGLYITILKGDMVIMVMRKNQGYINQGFHSGLDKGLKSFPSSGLSYRLVRGFPSGLILISRAMKKAL